MLKGILSELYHRPYLGEPVIVLLGELVLGPGWTQSQVWYRCEHVVDDVAQTCTLCGGRRGGRWYTMWWMTWRAPIHYVVEDVASTGRCNMWWTTWWEPVHYCVEGDVASTGTLYGKCRGKHSRTCLSARHGSVSCALQCCFPAGGIPTHHSPGPHAPSDYQFILNVCSY